MRLPLVLFFGLVLPLAVFFSALPAAAIELVGPSEPIEVGQVVDFDCSGLTVAQLQNSDVTYFPREKARCKPYLSWGMSPRIEFSARQPGKYLLKVTAIIDGRLETSEVVITVTGEGPSPNPFPVPPVPDNLAVVVLSESSTRTPQEAILHEKIRDYLAKDGTPWRIVDPDIVDRLNEVPKWFSEIHQKTVTTALPAVVLCSKRPDGVYSFVAAEPLTTYDAAVKFIGGAK